MFFKAIRQHVTCFVADIDLTLNFLFISLFFKEDVFRLNLRLLQEMITTNNEQHIQHISLPNSNFSWK